MLIRTLPTESRVFSAIHTFLPILIFWGDDDVAANDDDHHDDDADDNNH